MGGTKKIQKQKIEVILCVIFHSDKSCNANSSQNDLMHISDAVLNVNDIASLGKKIYPDANIIKIKNAIHDIVLSSDEVIDNYFNHISKWLNQPFTS
ncbi:hypothetical protein MNBD_GAMMA07-1761 [hydrothermal vent metagenome]|uniref:Uncharacterized protein n=1 Tax=hydrothermal vent metagenome TaxID=652676 RepID=A0A3B0XML2_9ZZZZ